MPADRIYYFENHNRMSREAADIISDLMIRAIGSKAVCNMVLAGGTTPVNVYKLLGQKTTRRDDKPTPDWSAVNLFLGDERIVPRGDLDSNLTMVQSSLLQHIPQFSGTINFPDLSVNDPMKMAAQYEELIRSYFPKNTRWPLFDIVILGLGTDGHTASLFPDVSLSNPGERWVTKVTSKFAEHERISLTFEAINAAGTILVLVSGKAKRNIVRRVIDGDPSLPASRIRPSEGKLFYFISDL